MNFGQGMISSRGDIILSAGEEKKKKKLIIFIIVLLVIAVLLCGVLFLVWKMKSDTNSAVNKYNNYLFSDGNLNSNDSDDSDAAEISNNASGYYDEVVSYLDSIKSSVNKNIVLSEKKKQILLNDVDESREVVGCIATSIALVNMDGVMEFYKENGSLEGFLNLYNCSMDAIESNYGDDILNSYKTQVEYFDAIKNAGCMSKDGDEYYECVSNIEDTNFISLDISMQTYNYILRQDILVLFEKLVGLAAGMKGAL